MRANIELQNKWTLLRIVLNFDRKLPYHWDSLSHCTGGTHLHCHLRGTEEAATLSAPVMLSCRLSSEKQLHFDSPSISALGQLAPTYADVGNQSWSLEGRATVSKGHIRQLQLLSSRSIKGISLGSAWVLLTSLEEGIIESISLAVGKSNKRADIFKKLSHVSNQSWKNGKLCNFKFLTDLPLFQSKGKFDTSQLPCTHWFLTKDYSIPPQHLQRKEPHPYGSIMHGNRLTISIPFFLLQNIYSIYLYFHYSL